MRKGGLCLSEEIFWGEGGVSQIAVHCVHSVSPAHSSAAEQSSPELREVATHSLCALL